MAQLKGFDETIKALRNFGKESEAVIEAVIEATAFDIQKKAKELVPKDTGKLDQSIISQKVEPLHWQVEAGGAYAPYAPYIEFGTGGLVDVPVEFKDEAWLAKGKGIRQVNIFPQPYMHPAYLMGQKQIVKDLEKELDKLTKAT